MADGRPKSTTELLAAIDAEWRELQRVIQHLTPAQMNKPDEGGWSPKDNLAHIAEWLKILMGYHMDQRPAHEVLGVPIEITRDWDMDVINPVLFERNQERTAEDVVRELEKVYGDLTTKLRATPFDELMKPRHADDPEQRPVLDWVLGDTTEHMAEHRATIEKAL